MCAAIGSESKATLLKGRARAYNVLKFFAAKFSQPQLSGSAREWNRLVGDAYARVQANAKMQAEGSIAPVSESFNDAQKQRAAEATKRAPEELQKRKVERETKRKVSLDSARVVGVSVPPLTAA